jgi:hypothetical protein
MAPFQLIVCVSVLIFIGKEIVKPVQLRMKQLSAKVCWSASTTYLLQFDTHDAGIFYQWPRVVFPPCVIQKKIILVLSVFVYPTIVDRWHRCNSINPHQNSLWFDSDLHGLQIVLLASKLLYRPISRISACVCFSYRHAVNDLDSPGWIKKKRSSAIFNSRDFCCCCIGLSTTCVQYTCR